MSLASANGKVGAVGKETAALKCLAAHLLSRLVRLLLLARCGRLVRVFRFSWLSWLLLLWLIVRDGLAVCSYFFLLALALGLFGARRTCRFGCGIARSGVPISNRIVELMRNQMVVNAYPRAVCWAVEGAAEVAVRP